MQTWLNKPKHIGVFGKSGMGKTTFALKYVPASDHKRVVIYDQEGEFAQRLGLQPVYTFEEFFRSLEEKRVTCFDFSENFGGMAEQTFDQVAGIVVDLCKDVFSKRGWRVLLLCDEVQKFVSVNSMPENYKIAIETGRRLLLDTFSLSQRPNRVNGALLEQLTEAVMFKLDHPRSLEAAENLGFVASDVSSLEAHQYIYRNLQTGRDQSDRLVFA